MAGSCLSLARDTGRRPLEVLGRRIQEPGARGDGLTICSGEGTAGLKGVTPNKGIETCPSTMRGTGRSRDVLFLLWSDVSLGVRECPPRELGEHDLDRDADERLLCIERTPLALREKMGWSS